MPPSQNINIQEEYALRDIVELVLKNYRLFFISLFIAVSIAFFINRYSIRYYNISSSILIKENRLQQSSGGANDFLNSNLLGRNQNFQNEFWILKSYPVIEKTVKNLDLSVTYYTKGEFNYYDIYKNAPFIVYFIQDHIQPINVKFDITYLGGGVLNITAKSKNVSFYNFETNRTINRKGKWNFSQNVKMGDLIETDDLAFFIQPRDTTKKDFDRNIIYGFDLKKISSVSNVIRRRLDFTMADRLATVISVKLRTESIFKGIEILNELMSVYSEQNLEQKNHLAAITIQYIEKQLSEISDSLSQTEDYLQSFRSSRQLLNISDQATSLSSQHWDLQNQLADLVSREKYYTYVSELLRNDNFSNIMLPASIGISDQLLNNLISDLITAQSQRTNLIENNQERNPLVQKLGIQIENLKKTIIENINAGAKTTSMSVEEMNGRIKRIESEISRLPATQRQLGTIERKFRLNDAIYNYLMEKHAEAKITQASNLPDNLIIEPAKSGGSPVSPNKPRNYLVAVFLGFALPFGYILGKRALNNKIESQDDLEKLTKKPVLGKIMHNRHKTKNVMYEFPKSNIAESFRALRTNLDFYVRLKHKEVIMVTSSLENEGKSFVALNLAMSYAQLGKKTILVDFDLRKPKIYFKAEDDEEEGLSSYLIDKIKLEDILKKSPNENLDYIIAGILPPNPAELIAHERTEAILAKLKNDYDIIVMDTTPLAQVTDAYLLINYADVKIIIARQNFTLKKVFAFISRDLEQKNVENVCVVLNDNKIYTDQYGYGYGYYNVKKGLFKRKVKRHKHN